MPNIKLCSSRYPINLQQTQVVFHRKTSNFEIWFLNVFHFAFVLFKSCELLRKIGIDPEARLLYQASDLLKHFQNRLINV